MTHEMTCHRVAVVVFAEVDAVDFADAAFLTETAIRQALVSASVPGRARGYIMARLRNAMTALVKWSRVSEINCARDVLLVSPVSRVFESGEQE